MGWLFGWNSRKELIDHLSEPEARRYVPKDNWNKRGLFGTKEVLKKATVGNHLWMVARYTAEYADSPDGPVTETKVETVILLFLLSRHRKNEWGYKDISESMGPAYYTCPLAYLDMVPVPGGPYAAGWREKVREYHARRGVKVMVGDTLILNDGCNPNRFTVTKVKPLLGRADDGRVFKIPRKMIKGVEPATEKVAV